MSGRRQVRRTFYIDEDLYYQLVEYVRRNYQIPWGHQSEVVNQALREFLERRFESRERK